MKRAVKTTVVFLTFLMAAFGVRMPGTVVAKQAPPFLRCVRFIDEFHGWISGYRGVYYTSDGGHSWVRESVPVGDVSRFRPTAALLNTGWIAWADNLSVVLRGDEGIVVGDLPTGIWRKQPLEKELRDNTYLLSFSDRKNGWAAGFHDIYKTSDGGTTWSIAKSRVSGDVLRQLFAVSPKELWAVGLGGTVVYTLDGGNTWQGSSRLREDFVDVEFLANSHGWLCGWFGTIHVTKDAGMTWTRLLVANGVTIEAMSVAGQRELWLTGRRHSGNNVVFHSCDGGVQWRTFEAGSGDRLVDVHGLPSGAAWVIGSQGAVFRTQDHGKTWSTVKLP